MSKGWSLRALSNHTGYHKGLGEGGPGKGGEFICKVIYVDPYRQIQVDECGPIL